MKVKRLKVGIRPLEEGLQEFGETLKALQTGKTLSKQRGVYFVSVEAMRTGAHAITLDLAPHNPDSSSSFDCRAGKTNSQGLQKCPCRSETPG